MLRACGGGGDKGPVDPTQSSLSSIFQKLRSGGRGTNLSLLTEDLWTLQPIAACPKGARDLVPQSMLGDAPCTSVGAGPGRPPPSLHPAEPWSHCCSPLGTEVPSPMPGTPRGWGGAGGCLAPATQGEDGLIRDLFRLLGDQIIHLLVTGECRESAPAKAAEGFTPALQPGPCLPTGCSAQLPWTGETRPAWGSQAATGLGASSPGEQDPHSIVERTSELCPHCTALQEGFALLHWIFGKKNLPCEDAEALAHIAQGNSGCPIPASVPDQDGRGLEKPDLLEGVPARGRQMGLDGLWFLSIPFWDSVIQSRATLKDQMSPTGSMGGLGVAPQHSSAQPSPAQPPQHPPPPAGTSLPLHTGSPERANRLFRRARQKGNSLGENNIFIKCLKSFGGGKWEGRGIRVPVCV